MKLSPLLVLTGLGCWFLFVLGTIMGFVAGIGALVLSLPLQFVKLEWAQRLRRYAGNNIHAADCSAAASLGFSGDRTISKECGLQINQGEPCDFCNYLCAALDKVDPDHCRREGS